MGGVTIVKFRDSCPNCFIEKGYSVEMRKEEDGIFQCPMEREHKFRRNENGYWEKVR